MGRGTSEAASIVWDGTWARRAAPKVSAPVKAVAQRQDGTPNRGEPGSERMRWRTQLAERKWTPRPTARRAMRGEARWSARLRGSDGGSPCLLTRARAPK